MTIHMQTKIFGDLFGSPKLKTPKDILVEFKKQIEIESRGEVTADIRTVAGMDPSIVSCAFAIKSDKTNYSYVIFWLNYDVLMYPCVINSEELIIKEAELYSEINNVRLSSGFPLVGIACRSEDELNDKLLKLLKTDRVISIVRAIYSQ